MAHFVEELQLEAERAILAMQTAALAARERPDDLLLIGALEVEAADVGARRHLELADLQDVAALGQFLEYGFRAVQAVT